MEERLFNTPAKQRLGLNTFTNLKRYVGWKLVVQILQAQIEVLTEQIVNGFEGSTPEEMDRKRDKLKVYKEVVELPDLMLKKLGVDESQQDENDPYSMVGVDEPVGEGVLDS